MDHHDRHSHTAAITSDTTRRKLVVTPDSMALG